jgi:acetyl-CoA carboxylase biotin carboxylase subunit
MFNKVAIANRGAVAARLVRVLAQMGAKSLVLCSECDQDLPYVKEADEFRVIGPPPPKDSYLNREAIIAAAKEAKAEAVHPGYGFLAEDALLAQRLKEEGLVFVGPSPGLIEMMGNKVAAKEVMAQNGFPLSPSTPVLSGSLKERAATAKALGFPLLIKPSRGGGGIGMIPVLSEEGLEGALDAAASQAHRGFGKDELYAERLLVNPRHVEIQIAGDGTEAISFFERDCSIQRRRQKILEEAGAPGISRSLLSEIAKKAVSAMAALGYDSLGTVETLWNLESGFSFLEVNPRLQVEHGVTEEVTGLDLVALQLRLAAGESLRPIIAELSPDHLSALSKEPQGHAIEARIYAEDSLRFLPSPGTLSTFSPPKISPSVRFETGYAQGSKVTPYYDPMVAQVIVKGRNRLEAIEALKTALWQFEVEGIKTNIPFLLAMLDYQPYLSGEIHTGLAEKLVSEPVYRERLAARK